jgi:purine-binding chemotaxis protein CheW
VQEVARIVSVDTAALQDAASALRALRVDRAYLRGVGETDGEVFVAVDPDEIIAPILSA